MVIHHIMALLAYVFVMVCFLRYLKVFVYIRYTVVKYCSSLETHFLIGSFKEATFFSTRRSDCRGGTGLKTVFVSVCANLQHI